MARYTDPQRWELVCVARYGAHVRWNLAGFGRTNARRSELHERTAPRPDHTLQMNR